MSKDALDAARDYVDKKLGLPREIGIEGICRALLKAHEALEKIATLADHRPVKFGPVALQVLAQIKPIARSALNGEKGE